MKEVRTHYYTLKHALAGAVFLALISFLNQCHQATSVFKTSNAAMQLNAITSAGDPLEIPVEIKLNGEYLKAFLVAYSSFKDDDLIPDQKKQIENYHIEFRQRGAYCRKPSKWAILTCWATARPTSWISVMWSTESNC